MRIVVISPVRAIAEAIARVLGMLAKSDVTFGVATSPREIPQYLRPDVVALVDSAVVTAATCDDLQRRIHGSPPIAVFGISGNPRELCFCHLWRATGLVGSGATLDELSEAAERLAAGHLYVAPSAWRAIRGAGLSVSRTPGACELTEREREVANLVVFGGSNAAIANVLGISVETTRIHVKHILRKLEVDTRENVARKYVALLAPQYEASRDELRSTVPR
jgi:DNA-binding NarL/FixJ family response regulator